MPYRMTPGPLRPPWARFSVPVDLSPWRAGRVVCVDGRAWLEIMRCELLDRVCFPTTRDRKFATVDSPQLDLVMNRLEWVTADDAPPEALALGSEVVRRGTFEPLIVAGQAWQVMGCDWQCSTLAAHPKTDVVDALVQLKLSLIRAWWADPPATETTARTDGPAC